jgi:hypothetical protein
VVAAQARAQLMEPRVDEARRARRSLDRELRQAAYLIPIARLVSHLPQSVGAAIETLGSMR